MEHIKNESSESINLDNVQPKSQYSSPKIMEVGSVEELTHGSREQTSDNGSGYYGG